MKTQIMREAKFSIQKNNAQRLHCQTRSVILDGSTSTTHLLENLSESEREVLYKQVKKALNKERRRACARADTYDMGRHVNLYFLAKKLALVT